MPRQKQAFDPDDMLAVFRLRWEEGLNNLSISKKLKIDPRRVRSLLEEAGRWMISEHQRLRDLESQQAMETSLESQLIAKYPHLLRVLIARNIETGNKEARYAALIREWSKLAAHYFDTLCDLAAKESRNLHVMMSGGETILETVINLPERVRPNVFYYSSAAIGRTHVERSSHVDPSANATIAWARSGRIAGRCIYATASPYEMSDFQRASHEAKRREAMSQVRELLRLGSIKEHLEQQAEKVNVAFVGLGLVISPQGAPGLRNRLTATGLLHSTTGINSADLAAEGAVGDLAYCLFDSNGNGDNKRWRFFLTAGDHDPALQGVGFYRTMVNRGQPVIAIAGTYKGLAIRAALKGKLFNVWVTDEKMARDILRDA